MPAHWRTGTIGIRDEAKLCLKATKKMLDLEVLPVGSTFTISNLYERKVGPRACIVYVMRVLRGLKMLSQIKSEEIGDTQYRWKGYNMDDLIVQIQKIFENNEISEDVVWNITQDMIKTFASSRKGTRVYLAQINAEYYGNVDEYCRLKIVSSILEGVNIIQPLDDERGGFKYIGPRFLEEKDEIDYEQWRQTLIYIGDDTAAICKSRCSGFQKRMRCKKCAGCTAPICGECRPCNVPSMKKPCVNRPCLFPIIARCPCLQVENNSQNSTARKRPRSDHIYEELNDTTTNEFQPNKQAILDKIEEGEQKLNAMKQERNDLKQELHDLKQKLNQEEQKLDDLQEELDRKSEILQKKLFKKIKKLQEKLDQKNQILHDLTEENVKKNQEVDNLLEKVDRKNQVIHDLSEENVQKTQKLAIQKGRCDSFENQQNILMHILNIPENERNFGTLREELENLKTNYVAEKERAEHLATTIS